MKKLAIICIAVLGIFGEITAQTSNPTQYKYVFTVAKDGTGDYFFIQDAIDAMRVYPLASITLYIKNGVYNEKISLPANNTDVSFIGQSADSTIIIFKDYAGKGNHTTFTSYTAKISGNRFRAEHISFVNAAGAVGQALALYVDADKAVFKDCKFLGNQDTIFLGGENANQLFQDCYIEGTTDFIFGPATAVFQHCTIRCKSNSFITAASTTAGKKFGFVFLNCIVKADSSVNKLYLGRPWRANAKTAFLYSTLPAVIAPEGWDNWGNTANEQTAYFAEYKNNGDGSNAKQRATWTKNISEQQAKTYTLAKIFSATPQDNWFNIATTKSFDLNYFNTKHIEVLPLYAAAIPNATAAPDKENSTITDILRIAKVSKPTMTLYKPDKPNGKAVIICPGGGYGILAWEKEGTKVAELFNSWGITAFVLKYRLPDDTTMIDKSIAPLQDAQQAIRLVRSNAAKWNINPRSIGIMGFSAGGHLASTAATHFSYNADPATTDTTSVRPDFAILLYPVVSFDQAITHKGSKNNLLGPNPTAEKVAFYSNELQVTASTPPSFLVHAGDDGAVPVENSVRYYLACIKNKVPAEMHLYPKGGHGFGLNNATTTDIWMDRMHNWLNNLR